MNGSVGDKMRTFITKEDFKQRMWVNTIILPILLCIGYLGVILGNRDAFQMTIFFILTFVLFLTYTKRKTKKGKQNSKVKQKKKDKKGKFRVVVSVVILILYMFILYDTVKYTSAMAQVQFNNEGYVTGKVRSGGYEGNLYVKESKDGKEYMHIFEGWKYLSKVKVDKELEE